MTLLMKFITHFVWQTASNVLLLKRNIINNINSIISDINGTEQLCHKQGDLFVISGCKESYLLCLDVCFNRPSVG